MIDERSLDGIGWARFSDDRTKRYRLSRQLTQNTSQWASRIVFIMLNPSTADAFKVDPTIRKCCQFAVRWAADVLEVVNLFALRSTDPKALNTAWPLVGAGDDNDAQILQAYVGASRVIAAWGNHGARNDRGAYVRKMLVARGVKLEHLGLTDDGFPKHPLARGKHFIPLTREPEAWA